MLKGKELLAANDAICNELEIGENVFENSKRKVVIVKAAKAYSLFKQLINFYAANQIIAFIKEKKIENIAQFNKQLPAPARQNEWLNIGGQLILKNEVDILKTKIKTNKIKSWDEVHSFYKTTAR